MPSQYSPLFRTHFSILLSQPLFFVYPVGKLFFLFFSSREQSGIIFEGKVLSQARISITSNPESAAPKVKNRWLYHTDVYSCSLLWLKALIYKIRTHSHMQFGPKTRASCVGYIDGNHFGWWRMFVLTLPDRHVWSCSCAAGLSRFS